MRQEDATKNIMDKKILIRLKATSDTRYGILRKNIEAVKISKGKIETR